MTTRPRSSSSIARWAVVLACLPLLLAGCGNAPQAGPSATATPTASPTPSATATPLPQFSDPLTTDTGQWPVIPSHCQFTNGGYQVHAAFRSANFITTTNGAMAVEVKVTAGTTGQAFAGLFWRAFTGALYALFAKPIGGWAFVKQVGGTNTLIDSAGYSPMSQHLDVTNTQAVTFRGSHFQFMINGVQAGQGDDASLTGEGAIGMVAGNDCTAVFNNFAFFT